MATFVLKQYNLNITYAGSGSGDVTLDPSGGVYTHGQSVIMTAYPNAGSTFTGWSDDHGGTTNPDSIVMNAEKNVVAGFDLSLVTISGTVSTGAGSGVGTLSSMDDYKAMSALLEKEKKQFKGNELAGQTLGVVGLGAIGSRVAQTALLLGMEVIGFDPALSVDAAWRLPSDVKKMENLSSLFARANYVTLHLPALDSTRNLINAEALNAFRDGSVLLNFARDEIVDVSAVVSALKSGKLRKYISDFPHPELLPLEGNVCMPHIGASTDEAEDNCAIMVARQLKDFLENGNITNAVNFPTLQLERTSGFRLAITNHNVPRMLGLVTSVLADANINVIDLLNKSRNDIAYNLFDLESAPSDAVIEQLAAVEGVINVRLL